MRYLAATLAAIALLACPLSAGAAPLPKGFMGVLADGPLLAPDAPLASEAQVMGRSGVRTLRIVFAWNEAQPYPTIDQVPEGARAQFSVRHGVPTDFRGTDRIVRAAALAGIEVLPIVQIAPDWAAAHPGPFTDPLRYGSPPARAADYARFMRTLVERYGPQGDFWRSLNRRYKRPIRRWQVWNEPMIPIFWNDQPFGRSYAPVLRAAYRAVHLADEGAEVLTAGMPNLGPGRGAWNWLSELYGAGGRGAFDAVAIHPYARSPENVLRTVRVVRGLMQVRGDGRLPIVITELAWSRRVSLGAAAGPLTSVDATVAGQARRLRAAYRLLAKYSARLGIEGAVWASWLSAEQDPADWPQWSGLSALRDGQIVRTPALGAYAAVARALERAA